MLLHACFYIHLHALYLLLHTNHANFPLAFLLSVLLLLSALHFENWTHLVCLIYDFTTLPSYFQWSGELLVTGWCLVVCLKEGLDRFLEIHHRLQMTSMYNLLDLDVGYLTMSDPREQQQVAGLVCSLTHLVDNCEIHKAGWDGLLAQSSRAYVCSYALNLAYIMALRVIPPWLFSTIPHTHSLARVKFEKGEC